MSLPGLSVSRPVAISCLIIGLTFLGINAYRKIGLELFPNVDMPYVTVLTIYPGGSPQEIETDIAKRIEDVVVSINGLKHVTSTCMENVCHTLLEFNIEVDVDVAANDVREKLDLIVNDFPSGTEKPNVLKFDINAVPIIDLALTGDVPIEELYDFADNTLRDRLTVISGVAEVQLIGGAEREVQVLLDRTKLAARGLTSLDVVETLQREVRTIPSGRIQEGDSEFTVKLDAEYEAVSNIGELQISGQDGARCYLRDVARIEMGMAELRQASFLDGEACIGIRVVKRSDANAVEVVRAVDAAMDQLRQTLPGGLDLVWIRDDGAFITATVDSTTSDIIQGIFLTAMILFFFLYNIRTTIIVGITMPLTIIIALFFIQAFDYTLNVSTLMAMGLSVGILVTNSIVVLESITKKFEESGNAVEAAREGAGEVMTAVFASAGTNIVVLFPIAIMSGMIGFFMAPFAWTMIIMTAVSLFISFTLTPILCSVLLKVRTHWRWSPIGFMERLWNGLFQRLASGFAYILRFFERRRWAAILFLISTAFIFYQSLKIAGIVGVTFFAHADRGEIYVKLEYPTRLNLEETMDRVRELEQRLEALPELRHQFTTIGKVEGVIGRSSEGVFLAQILLKFSEKTERTIPIKSLLEETRELLKDIPGVIVSVSQPSGIGGQSTPIELEIAGDEFDELDRLALQIEDFANRLDGYKDLDTTVRVGKPEIRVRPNRAILADLGIPATAVGMMMRSNIEGIDAGTYKESGRNYDIVVKMEEQFGKDQVREFLLPAMPGRPMLLSNIGRIEETEAPVQITRKNKQRISKVFADLDLGTPLGTAVDQLSQRIDEDAQLPPGYSYAFVGEYEIMQESIAEFIEAAVIAIVLVFLVLAAILESFKQPFIILITLPLGIIGVLMALLIGGESISMFVMLGGVMLIGIVVNNAILIIDRVNQLIHLGVHRHEAMIRATAEEFRPIIMITLAAILGMWPLATGSGLGSEMRTALGVASIGGIAISALLTLLVIPILYDLFTRREHVKHEPLPPEAETPLPEGNGEV